MIKILFFALLILNILPANGMKRLRCNDDDPSRKKICLDATHFFSLLPPEIQTIIINFYPHQKTTNSAKNAIITFKALAFTNKKFYNIIKINDKKQSDKYIKDFARTFYCSHETIAERFNTQQSNQCLILQKKLKLLCCNTQWDDEANRSHLNRLIEQGVDLEFTYNHCNLQKTALMITSLKNNGLFKYLQKKSNINTTNSHGMTVLNFLVEFSTNLKNRKLLLKHPLLAINQQNRHGQTALLRCIIHKNTLLLRPVLIDIVGDLLNAGADPEIADNNGLTPLIAAKEIGAHLIANLIDVAIIKKYAQKT